MKKLSFFTGIVTTVAIIFSLSANAQNIEEKDLKVNVSPINNSLQSLAALKPIKFNYNLDKLRGVKFPSNTQFGFDTKTVSEEFPELIQHQTKSIPAGKNQFKSIKFKDVDQASLIPVLVAAIKEQQKQIDELKASIVQLKAK